MTTIEVPIKRHPVVATRRLPLTEQMHAHQVRRGMFTTDRGEPFAIPADSMRDRSRLLGVTLWERDAAGRVFRPGVRFSPLISDPADRGLFPADLDILRAAEESNPGFEERLRKAHLGYDTHISLRGDLYARHFHAGWANPFTGEIGAPLDPTFHTLLATHWGPKHLICRLGEQCPAVIWPSPDACLVALQSVRGWTEDLGWLSGGKVTTAFRGEIIDELVSATGTEFADFDFHEVGTSTQAEANTDTALIATSGIARATGTPTDADPIYRNVATVTADATETWEEHGLFNNSSGAALLDRSLTGGQSVVSSDEVEYTHETTFSAEA